MIKRKRKIRYDQLKKVNEKEKENKKKEKEKRKNIM